MTATSWPPRSSAVASSLPTRPHPTTTTCTMASRLWERLRIVVVVIGVAPLAVLALFSSDRSAVAC
jgi:hypothetical protein